MHVMKKRPFRVEASVYLTLYGIEAEGSFTGFVKMTSVDPVV
jgi:hypothetical protein